MYPHFIEIHRGDQKAIVNIDHIQAVSKGEMLLTVGSTHPEESYEELKQLIEASGCLIRMGDPRLDTSHPLTMQDLKQMIGEPVWNSNRNKWLLVRCENWGSFSFIDHDGYGYDATENDLIECPLYRMKVNHDGE